MKEPEPMENIELVGEQRIKSLKPIMVYLCLGTYKRRRKKYKNMLYKTVLIVAELFSVRVLELSDNTIDKPGNIKIG